jgi:5'-3' exoribonuclease 2
VCILCQCCHPEEGGSFTETEMLERIWAYVCRLVSIARPRRLVYLAIDGVAPRAKMNQQRSRRFRAAREAEQKAEVHAKLKQEWLARGLKLPPKLKGSQEEWDSNVITVRLTDMAAAHTR